MKRILLFILLGTLVSSCATSKKQSSISSQVNQNYAFELLPELKGLPAKVRNFTMPDGSFKEGIITSDGNYLLLGKMKRRENLIQGRRMKHIRNPFLFKINDQGAVLWKVSLDSLKGKSVLSIADVNGDYVLFSSDSTIITLSANGEQMNTHAIDFSARSMTSVDNELVFTLLKNDKLSVIWTDKTGQVQDKYKIADEQLSFTSEIQFDGQKNWYACAKSKDKDTTATFIHVFKYDQDGKKQWKKSYQVGNGFTGSLRNYKMSVHKNNLGIVTNKEIMVLDLSGNLQYQYHVPENDPDFSNGLLLQNLEMLFVQYTYRPNELLIKRVNQRGEVDDLTTYLYTNDSLSQAKRRRAVRMTSRVLLNKGQNLLLAGSASAGSRQSPYVRNIVLNQPALCADVEVIDSLKKLSFSEKRARFKNNEWIEDSIRIKNNGSSLLYLSNSNRNHVRQIQFIQNQTNIPIYPGKERTVYIKYSKNASSIYFSFHGIICQNKSLHFKL